MALRELVEDQLILAFPYAARHADCDASAAQGGDERLLPFAGLKGLLRGRH
jgi:uncharacterized metal-binding protein YceD (DUF177 family)